MPGKQVATDHHASRKPAISAFPQLSRNKRLNAEPGAASI
jgi:hypothetical protein